MGCSKRTICGCCVLAVALSAGCGRNAAERSTDGRLPVFAGIPPLAYLVEQIGGPHVAVEVLVQPGQDPHTFEPTPRQVAALSRAKIFFAIGLPFESVLVEKLRPGNPQMMIVDVSAGVEKRPMDRPCRELAAERDHDDADHRGAPDPHVWLSPPLLKIQAANVAAALARADPANKDDYQRNLAALLERIDAVHRRIERTLAPYRGRTFFVFHPGFGYFADAYGLKEEAIEAGGRPPSPKQLQALIEKAGAEGVKTVFVQPQFDPHGAQAIARSLGGDVVAIDGLKKDVLYNLEEIAAKIASSFAASSK